MSPWAQRRSALIGRNSLANGCAQKEIELPHGVRRRIGLCRPSLLMCYAGHVAKDVETSVGSLPRCFLASVFARALLFFVLVYFGGFALEATCLCHFLPLWIPFIGPSGWRLHRGNGGLRSRADWSSWQSSKLTERFSGGRILER